MKFFTIYKATSGLWFVQHSMKGTDKLRTWPMTGTIQECINRFEEKGYTFWNKYGYSKEGLISETGSSKNKF